jgi:O-antigen/teichoic acid export membrane protein
MDLFSRFKKDYLNYFLSVLLPAFIAGISVPVFKHLLGAKGYGNFSIYYNSVLICTAVATGWITQSIVRFYPTFINKSHFANRAISISLFTLLIFFIPVLLFAWYWSGNLVLGIFVCLTLFITTMQFTYMAIAQAGFLSKKTIYSETIRAVSYILIAIMLLVFFRKNYLYELFIAVIISFTLSVLYLRKQTGFFFLKNTGEENEKLSELKLAKRFFKYGAPLSLWLVFAYLLSYVDKLGMNKNIGAEQQGNYQAVFDLLSRGITLLISPVIISLFPLLTLAYEKREMSAIKQLLKKIILFEFLGLLAASVLYWLFGANLLFIILKIPNTSTYRLMGFIVLATTFFWQMAMVVHQQFVLQEKTLFLLLLVFVAFSSQLLLYWIYRKSTSPLVYPFGYLLSALVYLFFVSLSQARIYFKNFIFPD